MTYTECDEIADEIKAPVINNFSEALVIVRRMLPDESETMPIRLTPNNARD